MIAGIRVITSPSCPRPGAIISADPAVLGSEVIFVHPDEKHMLYAASGEITKAFHILNATLQRNIASQTRAALARLTMMGTSA